MPKPVVWNVEGDTEWRRRRGGGRAEELGRLDGREEGVGRGGGVEEGGDERRGKNCVMRDWREGEAEEVDRGDEW